MISPAAADLVAAAPCDEMVDGAGRLRPPWDRLLGTLAQLGPEDLAGRVRTLDQLLAEEGAGGLLPGRGSPASPRRLDPIPLPLAAAEFAALEAGLAQRARLLDLVLRDVYGPQALLAEGVLPPALVQANPAFLRPCRATDPGAWPGGQRLHLYAAELVRGPDGVWRVLADRTADAAGLGYALLNRRAMVRVMPELFSAAGPHALRRLRPFFDAWQDALQRMAGGAGANPGLALLTPGPSDKLWFEHLVLSRELSCTLVEGGDLTARDGALYLKTLRGLQRVDLLLRRQDGRMVDPLELEPGAMHGVTGLLDAARWGGVRIVNDPGAGFAEAPALAAFLPALAERLLGEPLRLPAVPALWLGEAEARARLQAEPGRWRLRPALDGTAPTLRPGATRDLDTRLAAAPGEFAALAVCAPSLAPWATAEGGMAPRPLVLRMFLASDGAGGWQALPGGFARAVTPEDLAAGRLPLHGAAKDVWVSAAEEEDAIRGPGMLALAALPIRRTAGDLPSRVADNFFWLGRYLERLEAAARLLRVTVLALERPEPTPREMAELKSLGACLAAAKLLDAEEAAGFGAVVAAGASAAALLRVVRGGGAPSHNSLPGLLAEVSRLAGQLRDRLTGEVHDTITHGLRGLRDTLAALPSARDERRGLEPLAQAMTAVLTFSAAVSGLAAENMVRGGGRLFLDLGRRVERAQAIATELARLLEQPGATVQPARLEPGLRLALELRDSVITYRNRYLSVVQAAPVLDLVLADAGNPRGLAFQLVAARELLAELAAGGEPGDAAFAEAAGALLAEAEDMVRRVATAPASGAAAAAATELPVRLKALAGAVAALSDAVSRRYFALLPAVRSLGVGLAETTPALRGAA